MRLRRDEQVALLTCAGGHHALLLDSRDYWHDVIQSGRPREVRCRCGARVFAVDLEYRFRADESSVRTVDVWLRCAGCGAQRHGVAFEIDYEPTDTLVSRPLDPCPDPWRKAKQTELTALWVPDDLHALVVHLVEELRAHCYVGGWREPARPCSSSEAIATLRAHTSWTLLFAARPVELPGELRDCWRRLPVIQLETPITIRYQTGKGWLHYVHYANERFVDGELVAQDPELLALATRLRAWLQSRFTSVRGRGTFDNPREHERLKGGW